MRESELTSDEDDNIETKQTGSVAGMRWNCLRKPVSQNASFVRRLKSRVFKDFKFTTQILRFNALHGVVVLNL